MSIEKYFITRQQPKANHAGSKAVRDTEIILEEEGYKKIGIYPKRGGNAIVRKLVNYSSLSGIKNIKPDSLVVVEHPLYISNKYIELLEKVKEAKRLKVAFLIHDFETIRCLFPDDMVVRSVEKKLLKIADYIIVHNEKMLGYFVDKFKFPEDRLINLRLFDYLCKGEKKGVTDGAISIAGNLNPQKSGYIYELASGAKELTFNMYGVNYDEDKAGANCLYKGSVDADELPNVIDGRFGLVWDGTAVDSCNGATGEYLKLNNPHKASLYTAAGLPIIIWSKAALADLVEKEKIGFSVNSLTDIPEKLRGLSDEEYDQFKKNLENLSEKVRTGYFFRKALEELESRLDIR